MPLTRGMLILTYLAVVKVTTSQTAYLNGHRSCSTKQERGELRVLTRMNSTFCILRRKTRNRHNALHKKQDSTVRNFEQVLTIAAYLLVTYLFGYMI